MGRQNGASYGALDRVPTQLPAPPHSPLRTQVGQQPIVRHLRDKKVSAPPPRTEVNELSKLKFGNLGFD